MSSRESMRIGMLRLMMFWIINILLNESSVVFCSVCLKFWKITFEKTKTTQSNLFRTILVCFEVEEQASDLVAMIWEENCLLPKNGRPAHGARRSAGVNCFWRSAPWKFFGCFFHLCLSLLSCWFISPTRKSFLFVLTSQF